MKPLYACGKLQLKSQLQSLIISFLQFIIQSLNF